MTRSYRGYDDAIVGVFEAVRQEHVAKNHVAAITAVASAGARSVIPSSIMASEVRLDFGAGRRAMSGQRAAS